MVDASISLRLADAVSGLGACVPGGQTWQFRAAVGTGGGSPYLQNIGIKYERQADNQEFLITFYLKIEIVYLILNKNKSIFLLKTE